MSFQLQKKLSLRKKESEMVRLNPPLLPTDVLTTQLCPGTLTPGVWVGPKAQGTSFLGDSEDSSVDCDCPGAVLALSLTRWVTLATYFTPLSLATLLQTEVTNTSRRSSKD